MRRISIAVIAVLALLIIASTSQLSYSCTSFAVYSEQTVFGMNFDYLPKSQQKFKILSGSQGKIFYLATTTLYGQYDVADVAGMNIKGVFAANQMLIPQGKLPDEKSENQIPLWLVRQMALSKFERTQDVRKFIEKKQLINTVPSLHTIVADRFGDAMVFEAGDTENQISHLKDRYIVMTNFPYYLIKGKNYKDAYGFGAKRFKIAHQYIRKNFEDFDIEKGFALLKAVWNTSEICPTRCSMVFDPQRREVYISFGKDFRKIWKVSLENQTIETHRGFSNFKRQSIPFEGVSAEDLAKW